MKKLEYFDLLSYDPILIPSVGYVRKPLLKDISDLTFEVYQMYINMIVIDYDKILELTGLDKKDQDPEATKYDIIINNNNLRKLFLDILSFFIIGKISYDERYKSFINCQYNEEIEEDDIVGYVNNDNFITVCSCLLQINYLKGIEEKPKKISKRALYIMGIIENAKKEIAEKNSKNNSVNKNMSMANIISKLSTYSNSLNIVNIWNITVYQLYDQFYQQTSKKQNDIHSMNYAHYGGEFDLQSWYNSLDNNK